MAVIVLYTYLNCVPGPSGPELREQLRGDPPHVFVEIVDIDAFLWREPGDALRCRDGISRPGSVPASPAP